MDLSIRKANEADVQSLAWLMTELNPDDPPLSAEAGTQILSAIDAYPGSTVLLAEIGGEAAGTCTVHICPNLSRGGRPYALIENVVTAALHRRKGIGKALMAAAGEHAWSQNCYKAMLMSGSKDPNTLAFYRNCGFNDDKTGFQIRNGVRANPRI